ncbi:hypothetical protein S40285_01906 [Stachybotrys chlorohalonatus IBT 40285]|uniref:ABM domain-containing protein n=1 Tax=Stachybotrys chlorohalonatus (strain IBT 40285) TaxID=1283841 RepID=A0A084QQP7_STAC4|nr:hypothetical protein S40285_01906 [Stachybotrys chlorohalonata IBT 40285]
MSFRDLVTFVFFTFKPELQVSCPSAARAAWADITAASRAVPGIRSLYLGRQVERPGENRWVFVAGWTAAAPLAEFACSPTYAPWLASMSSRAVGGHLLLVRAFMAGTVDPALDAPVTELLTLYAVERDYLDAGLANFFEAVQTERLPGCHGIAWGEAQYPEDDDVEFPGEGALALLGWDSVEAHQSQRGEGKLIDNNIHFLRNGPKQIKMAHFPLTRL